MLDKTGELAGISGFFWGADSFNPGKDQYYEKTSVLSQASGLTNSTPNIINATYTDARGRKVGTITYGATASDDITTQFNYNPIGELIEVVDPIGLSTFYEYDLAGRVTQEKHPDRGVTHTVYDPASNVIQLETPGTLTFGGSVTMEYDYNRLVHKYMPLSSGADLYDIAYTYGTKGAAAKKERSSEVAAVQRLWAAGIPMTCAVFHCYRSMPRLVTGHWPL